MGRKRKRTKIMQKKIIIFSKGLCVKNAQLVKIIVSHASYV